MRLKTGRLATCAFCMGSCSVLVQARERILLQQMWAKQAED